MNFTISLEDCLRLIEWDKDHECTLTTQGAIGGRITYEFTPTGLGLITVVRCACGDKINLTNFENW